MVGGVIGVSVTSNNKPVEKVEATVTDVSVYLDCEKWDFDNAVFGAWVWGGSSADHFYAFNSTTTSHLYYANIPSDYTGFKFFRLSDSKRNDCVTYQFCPADNETDVYNSAQSSRANSNSNYFKVTDWWSGEFSSMDVPTNVTVYLVDGWGWHNTSSTPRVHIWGGTADTSWPGAAMSDTNIRLTAEVDSGGYTTLYANIHVLKYTISGTATSVLFVKDSGDGDYKEKTGDLSLTTNPIQVFFFKVSAEDYGDVVDLLVDISSKMGQATHDGKSYTNSICAINKSDAAMIKSEYTSLVNSGDNKVETSLFGNDVVLGSAINTYDPDNLSNNGNVTVEEIVDLFNKSSKYQLGGIVNAVIATGNSTDSYGALVIVLALTAVSGLSFLFFRRKKQ